ncbi:MAG: UPF0182 family protein [Euryarchaeota archaeon]|nr:UPF0182 family protein [Euryarchaeota archaeon]
MKRTDIVLSLAVLAALVSLSLVGIFTDYLWFSSLGYAQVFTKVWKTRLALGVLAALLFLAAAYANLALARRLGAPVRREVYLLVSAGMALFLGLVASRGWELFLWYANATPFGVTDPIFSRDVGFYVFSLPFYEFLLGVAFWAALFLAALTALIYLYGAGVALRERLMGEVVIELPEQAKLHAAVLAGIFALLFAFRFYLSRYRVLFTEKDTFFGAGYAEVKVYLPVLELLVVLSLAAALLFFASRRLGLRAPLAAASLTVVVAIGGSFITGAVQHYQVAPDEFNYERPYIEHSIKFTRLAYNLEDIKEVEFPANLNLSMEDIERNPETINNIRLWDYRPLKRTLEQLQLIRTYYAFNDVDVDRYVLNGEPVLVMLAARELNTEQLASRSLTWINEHLFYTHGYGIAMTLASEVSPEGLPVFLVKDIPPRSEYINITRPEIYYGELTNSYVIVRTKMEEFDYPRGEENVYTTYAGEGGVVLDSSLKRLAYALRFGSAKIFLSNSITDESRIMYYRNIRERVKKLAPFLAYDRDPYMVVVDGRLYWVVDAYTISSDYPYSEPTRGINYVRNSVKAVVDAYSGRVSLYISDERDPIIRTYAKAFPGLFRPLDEMPPGLRKHIRYPVDYFMIQAEKYATYHMVDARVFYNREDVWHVPQELYEGSRIRMEPYYLITKLPGEEKAEFILMLPFTPRNKNNLVAWLAARSDGENYGERIVYLFPKDKLVYGPMQIEARIDQNPEISQYFTLWDQAGTRVIRGNLLIIPIRESLLYVEPVFLRAEQEDAIPELKRVIVAFGERIAMEETLDEALSRVFGVSPEAAPPGTPATAPGKPKTREEVIEELVERYAAAREALRREDLLGFAREFEAMGRLIEELQKEE